MVNRLQTVFAQAKQEFDLPQVVCMGSQSSGKSSVIETLVGKDFLPRGRGIVTRVPLILQLVRAQEGEKEQWGEFVHDNRFSGKRFQDFSRIKRTIEEETDRLAGKSKGVANAPIILRVHSPNAVPLTLVDTPGLTRVPVEGQPPDIELQIKKMVSSYIEKPNSIILAVSPANQDIATSDALRLAKQFDPAGERTIGVLTKLDIMDKGTDALDVLSGRVYPLRLGFVGLICRSQQDIDTGKSLEESILSEQRFFMTHPAYSSIADVNGSKYLAVKCNRLLVGHIKKVLPKLKANIKQQIRTLESDLEKIGEAPPPEDATQRGYLMLRLIGNFANNFRAAIDGTRDELLLEPSDGNVAAAAHRLNGGARIRHIFNEVFDKTLQSIDPLEGLTDRDIQAAIRNAAGPKPAIFLPEAAFEMLAKRQIGKLREPALDCVDRVYNELLKIMLEMETNGKTIGLANQYAFLSDKIMEAGQKMLRKTTSPASSLIREVVEAECSYINTNHKDFVGLQMLQDPSKFAAAAPPSRSASSASSSRPSASQDSSASSGGGFFSSLFGSQAPPAPAPSSEGQRRSSAAASAPITLPNSPSEREQFQINLLKTLLTSYFGVVRKNIQDITVKIVWKNVVERAKEDMQRALMAELYKPELFDVMLRENPQVASQRIIFRERLKALRQAKEVISMTEIREDAQI